MIARKSGAHDNQAYGGGELCRYREERYFEKIVAAAAVSAARCCCCCYRSLLLLLVAAAARCCCSLLLLLLLLLLLWDVNGRGYALCGNQASKGRRALSHSQGQRIASGGVWRGYIRELSSFVAESSKYRAYEEDGEESFAVDRTCKVCMVCCCCRVWVIQWSFQEDERTRASRYLLLCWGPAKENYAQILFLFCFVSFLFYFFACVSVVR